jgi:hypothetical protein
MLFRKFIVPATFALILAALPAGHLALGNTLLLADNGTPSSNCQPGDANCQGTPNPVVPDVNPTPVPDQGQPPRIKHNSNEDRVRAPLNLESPDLRRNRHEHVMDHCTVDPARCGGDRSLHHRRDRQHFYNNHDFGYFNGWRDDDFYAPIPRYYVDYAVSCGEARSILKARGYQKIVTLSCGGKYHQFKAVRKGVRYQLKIRRSNGAIVVVRRYK